MNARTILNSTLRLAAVIAIIASIGSMAPGRAGASQSDDYNSAAVDTLSRICRSGGGTVTVNPQRDGNGYHGTDFICTGGVFGGWICIISTNMGISCVGPSSKPAQGNQTGAITSTDVVVAQPDLDGPVLDDSQTADPGQVIDSGEIVSDPAGDDETVPDPDEPVVDPAPEDGHFADATDASDQVIVADDSVAEPVDDSAVDVTVDVPAAEWTAAEPVDASFDQVDE